MLTLEPVFQDSPLDSEQQPGKKREWAPLQLSKLLRGYSETYTAGATPVVVFSAVSIKICCPRFPEGLHSEEKYYYGDRLILVGADERY